MKKPLPYFVLGLFRTFFRKWFLPVIGALTLSGCFPAKYVPEGQYLLSETRIKTNARQLNKSEMQTYIRQRPNKRVLGFRFHLWLYNRSKPEKNNWINRGFRQIGEAPVVFDEYQTSRSAEQLRLYLVNKGYFNAKVDHEVFFRKKEAYVTFNINSGTPYHIRSFHYSVEDTVLIPYLMRDTANSLVKPGIVYDVDVLQNERLRIESYLKNRGFYSFSKDYIWYTADTSQIMKSIDLTLNVGKYTEIDSRGKLVQGSHPRYKVRNLMVYASGREKRMSDSAAIIFSKTDTAIFDGIRFVAPGLSPVKPRTIASAIFIQPGQLYNQANVTKTYQRLSSLKVFRFTDIQFEEAKASGALSLERQLNGSIHLYPQEMQSYALEAEGTNSSGNIGMAGNFNYEHKNLFRGAERFNLRVKGAVETYPRQFASGFRNTIEFGMESGIRIPRFWLPLRTAQFVKRYSPSTSLSFAYNYQRRPDYTRTIANATFGYTWQGNAFNTFIVNPVELNAVKIFSIDPAFLESIKGKPYLENSYQDHFVLVSGLTFVFNNQNLRKKEDFVYFRTNMESAGNLLATYFNLSGKKGQLIGYDTTRRFYEIFGTQFSQFVRGELDFRYNHLLNPTDWLVYRFYAGVGFPYGNSLTMPFEKKFFAGGANSIRAWQVRTLGPGTYNDTISRYPNSLGDIKLEANVEYRFKLFWKLEGALFADAGNIWAIRNNDERPGALFKLNRFLSDIAVGTGTGFRFDFSFFIFRIDVGMKTRNPSLPKGERWTFLNHIPEKKDFALSIAIGYPF
ncbi:MAG TPA: BamA/TamA family outer membrane protein [Bacteroidales bacterium]|nr:BamA/TamA family outer membrane protein [Bacteroidales bacterium]